MVGSSLVIITWKFQPTNFGAYHPSLFLYMGIGHVIFSNISMLLIKLRYPSFNWQLAMQVICDIVFFSIMLYASGGPQSGFGVLLVISLAGAGFISRGHMTLLFALIATMGLFLQEIYSLLTIDVHSAQYTQASLLSMAYFAVACLAHQLAKHTLASEQHAQECAIDLVKMTLANQLVIQDLQEGVLIIDKDGNIRQRNTYAEKLLDLNPSIGKVELPRLSDYVPEITDRLSSWQGGRDSNFVLLRLTGTNTLVRARVVPIQSDFRNGAVIFIEDMKHIQAQLQQLKLAALGHLAANIAHEIRNPLSAINHAAELLEEVQVADSTDSRLVRIICNNTQRLNKIAQDVLQLNRPNNPKLDIINAHEFIQAFLNEFCHIESINMNTFILNSSKNILIHFDRDHLNQVLWNLCRNAWRHCRKQIGSIHIELSTGLDANNAQLDIVDDGPGIDPQQLKQIFEPFFTTATNGTGLGLCIAREICGSNHASLEYIENSTGGHFRIICISNPLCR